MKQDDDGGDEGELLDELKNIDGDGTSDGMGVYEFYIARRAVQKLVAYKKKWMQEQEERAAIER